MGDLLTTLSKPLSDCTKYVLNDCESDCALSNCFTCHVKTNEVDAEADETSPNHKG